MRSNEELRPADLLPALARLWPLSGAKIRALEETWPDDAGAPVVTVGGRWTAREWTEWTLGFRYGSALLQFDATGDEECLAIGRRGTRAEMVPHLTHAGGHDHGFQTISTWGNLWRLIREGRLPDEHGERTLGELAIRVSGAVQARRWTRTAEGGGFIHSFNGPHSLFADTIRTLRVLALAHLFGHYLLEEHDECVSLLERLVAHAQATATYSVYYGEGRDAWDVRGRVAHESLFDPNDGRYRAPGTQQGYSPFSTWTRGLAWVILGCAELLEFLPRLAEGELVPCGGRESVAALLTRAARATADYYLANTAADGIPYWDTGAPGLARLEGWRERPADPENGEEPVDASAAAIAAQGLLRLGQVLPGSAYGAAGLAVLRTLLAEPYLATSPAHQGLLRHCIYHRPNGWDHVPPGVRIPGGEASMWGDYHLREAALLVQRLARGETYPTFCGPPAAGGS
ncbi:MAG: glycosyl hydrolase [Planctomycetota bacterium]